MDSDPCPTGLTLRRILVDDVTVVIKAEDAASDRACPHYGLFTTRVHAHY